MKNFKIIRTVVEINFVRADDEETALALFYDGEVTKTFYEGVDGGKVIVTEEIE
jgi:hypothetical protein